MSDLSPAELEERLRREAEALEGCETEPIETIGTIQPFGALIALDPDVRKVTHVSENLPTLTGLDVQETLGSPLEPVFGRELSHRIRNVAGLRTVRTEREYLGTFEIGSRRVAVMVHATEQSFILELQAETDGVEATAAFGMVRQVMAQIDLDSSIEQLFKDAVHPLRDLSGFDRVMAYRFSPNGSGEVVAESRRATIESFLGLHFPAFDIPESARRLYAKTPIRMISDVTAEQSPIVAAPAVSTDPLDLSLAALRGTVPVHVQYLSNMGVSSSLTLPIVVEGNLWGLFAFHHREPRPLGVGLQMACEIAGRTLSMSFEQHVRKQRWSFAEQSNDLAADLLASIDGSAGYGIQWERVRHRLLDFIPCDGVALLTGTQVYVHGSCPPEDSLRRLNEQLEPGVNVAAFDDLIHRCEDLDLGPTAGALGVSIGGLPDARVLFLRDEAAQHLRWAGAPTKDIDETDGRLRLNPRASFAEFSELVAGRSFPWSIDDYVAGEALESMLTSLQRVRDASKQHQERLGLMVQELNHRVKNVLAMVQSLANQTRETNQDLDAYTRSLEQRLGALAVAHDLLTEREWGPVDLELLIRRTTSPSDPDFLRRVQIESTPVMLRATVASLFSLLIHELFSNAVRHGSLSAREGTVTVSWHLTEDFFVLGWRERGGPEVEEPTRRGFGSAIINEAVAFELEGAATVNYDPAGVMVEIQIPRRLVDAGETGDEPAQVTVDDAPDAVVPQDVLVVEDDFLVSRETVRMLQEMGCETVRGVASVHQALEMIEVDPPDFAVLDINLRGQFSGPVAERLTEKGIPFMFVTGYGSGYDLDAFVEARLLSKPVDRRLLQRAVTEVFAQSLA